MKILDRAEVGRRVRREHNTFHVWVFEPPMTATGLGRDEPLPLKLAANLLY